MISRLRGVAATIALLAALSGCTHQYLLEVRNAQGPAVHVIVNGGDFGNLPCRADSIVLLAGINAPPLPWHVDLVLENGEIFRSLEINGGHGPAQILVIWEPGVFLASPGDRQVAGIETIPCPGR